MKAIIYRDHIQTPLGRMTALATERGLCGLEFADTGRLGFLNRRLARYLGPVQFQDGEGSVLRKVRIWNEQYFAGAFKKLETPALDMFGTAFEKRVWEKLIEVPIGSVMTYGEIAGKIDCKSARAVGGSVGSNPFGLIIPCHRVVGANGALTGYGGGMNRKAWVLSHEGVPAVRAS